MFIKLVILTLVCNEAKTKLAPKVVRGEKADISRHPHAVYMYVEKDGSGYLCGASVINQAILLTAAHCLEILDHDRYYKCHAYTGHSNYKMGQRSEISSFIKHRGYDTTSMYNDIALVKLERPLKLGKFVQRVAIIKLRPPIAVLAAWGAIDDNRGITEHLQYATLRVWQYEECRKIITDLPLGFICAGQLYGKTYAGEGDSGGGLISKGFIQIGLVSFTRPGPTRGIVAFTDVFYHYDWIKKTSKQLYCN